MTDAPTLPRKLLDVACRIRVGETLFRDDELVDAAAHALKDAAAEIERLTAALAEAEAEELRLRRLLCAVYAGTAAYMDDGEASLGDRMPFIDFLRMPVAEIEAAMHQRAIDAVKEDNND